MDSNQETDFQLTNPKLIKDRENLIGELQSQGIRDPKVLDALRRTPRHLFVPETVQSQAYANKPLSIGQGQTISQPYIVAFMTEVLRPQSEDKVLEVGTGSGYQAAVLSPLVNQIYSLEIVPELGARSQSLLQRLGYSNIHTRIDDGALGWPEAAPFDKILLTAATHKVPQALFEQLKVGGLLLAPIKGDKAEQLVLFTKHSSDRIDSQELLPVSFVLLTGSSINLP